MTRRSDHSPQLQSYFSACATTSLKFRTPPPDSEFCLDSKQNSESGGGVLNLREVVAQAEKYDCNCGEWSERLVIQNPTAAATEFCSQMCRVSMKLCSGPWATRVKVGAG